MARTIDNRDPLIALRIPPALDAALRAEATATGATISAIVRVALEARLHTPPPLTATGGCVPPPPTTPRKGTRVTMCEHRIRPGNYCQRCNTVIG